MMRRLLADVAAVVVAVITILVIGAMVLDYVARVAG